MDTKEAFKAELVPVLVARFLSIDQVPVSDLLPPCAGALVIFDPRRFPYIDFLYFLSYIKMGVSGLTLLESSTQPQQ